MRRTIDKVGLKLMNRKVVFDLIRTKRKVTRVELSRLTGMSGPSILSIVDDFIEKGILSVGEKKNGAKGRSPVEMTYNPNVLLSVGAVFEGNDLSIGLVNLDGTILHQITERVPARLDEVFFKTLYNGLDRITEIARAEQLDYRGIGFGIPGVVDIADKRIHFAPYIGVTQSSDQSEILRQIEERYHCPVFIENDVNACALGEYHVRKLKEDVSDMLYISISSEIGAGLILDGKLRRGIHGSCGEIGYSVNRSDCEVSGMHTGWLEDKLSYISLCRQFEEYHRYGKVTDEMLAYIESVLAPVLANLINTLDLDRVVLGGKLMLNGGEVIIRKLRESLKRLTLFEVDLSAEHNSLSGVVGSALIASNELYDSIL